MSMIRMSRVALRAPAMQRRCMTLTEKVPPANFDASKVTVNQSAWPKEFRQFDAADPYKHSPTTSPFSAWGLLFFAAQLQFVLVFGEGEPEFAWVDTWRHYLEG